MAAEQPNNPLWRASLRGAEGAIFDLVFSKTTAKQWAEWLRFPLEHASGAGNLALVAKLQEAGAAGSALHAALRGGQHALARELLRLGASSTDKDNCGDTPLHLAAGFGHHGDIVPLLLRQGAVLDALDENGRTPLFLAAKRGDLPMAQALLAAGAAVGARCRDMEETALDLAAGSGHVDLLRALVRHGADVNADDATGTTALHAATLKNQVGAIDALMELGANIDVQGGQDDARWTPLHLASDHGLSQAVVALLRHGADVRRLGRNRDSALHLATRRGDPTTTHALLAAGASLTFRNSSDDSVLDSAASMGHVEVVQVLVRHGASVDATDSQGRTALFKADAEAVIDVLVAAGARVAGAVDSDGNTPLHAAAMLGHTPEAFLALLKHGARVDMRNSSGQTPLHTASVHGPFEGVEALLERGVDKNELTDRGRSPLSLAAENDRPHVTKVLLDAGADVSCPTEGRSALSLAACYGCSEVMEVLIRHCADLNARDCRDDTPLHEAARQNDAGSISVLIKAGASIEAQNDLGRTPLVVAFRSSMVRCLQDENFSCLERFTAVIALLKHGANANKRDTEKGSTLLHYSAERGCPLPVVHALLAADANVDLQDDDGCTPLHLAKDHPEILDALLENGADVDVQDSNGRTPLHKAADSGSVAAIEALVSAGAATSVTDEHGRTPLLAASWKCRRGAMQALLRSGAGVTSVDTEGRTALHLTAAGFADDGRYTEDIAETVRDAMDLLLRWGADERALDQTFGPEVLGRSAASYWIATAFLNSERASGAGNASVSKLLEMAPQDRAWRRRGWLVLCRALPDRVRLKADNGEAGTASPRSVRARGVGGGSLPADVPAAGEAETGAAGTAPCTNPAAGGLSVLVARVVGLDEEGVFRNIMAFV